MITAASAAGTFTLAGAMTALNIPMLAACAGIGLVVAGSILPYKNWDKVKAKAAELGAAVAAITAWFPLLGAVMQSWQQSVGNVCANIQAVFSNIVGFINNVFAGIWSAALENIVNIFGNLFGGLVHLAKAPINAVIAAINHVLAKINAISVMIPEWVPGVGGTTLGFSLPTIPILAASGIVTAPTILEAGEGGEPEAILPISRLAALLDGRNGIQKGGFSPEAPTEDRPRRGGRAGGSYFPRCSICTGMPGKRRPRRPPG